MKNFFISFFFVIKVLTLKNYYNVYLEGSSVNVVNFLDEVSSFIVQKQTEDTDSTYKSIMGKLQKISEYCEFMCKLI